MIDVVFLENITKIESIRFLFYLFAQFHFIWIVSRMTKLFPCVLYPKYAVFRMAFYLSLFFFLKTENMLFLIIYLKILTLSIFIAKTYSIYTLALLAYCMQWRPSTELRFFSVCMTSPIAVFLRFRVKINFNTYLVISRAEGLLLCKECVSPIIRVKMIHWGSYEKARWLIFHVTTAGCRVYIFGLYR